MFESCRGDVEDDCDPPLLDPFMINLICINWLINSFIFLTNNKLQVNDASLQPKQMLSVAWKIWVSVGESRICLEPKACQMLLSQHLFYHLKRVILPTMTVIPSERATLTEVSSHHGWVGLTECAHLHFVTYFLRILLGSECCRPMFGLPEFMHSMKRRANFHI